MQANYYIQVFCLNHNHKDNRDTIKEVKIQIIWVMIFSDLSNKNQ
jgi:hypothetical protein